MAIIEVDKLGRRYGPIAAVNDVTFAVDEGEIFGFLGPNGAGKTTTIKILATLLLPTSGHARLNGFDVVHQPHEVRRSIGIVFQDPSLDTRLTAEQNLRFHAMLYGVPDAVVGQRIDAVLDLVGLADRRRALVTTYSGGMRRRLEIARGLLHHPRVLFLDEPTLGLDPQTRTHIWEYVRDLRREEGITVFMTTHYMDEAEQCNRIGIIDYGRIVALDTPEALKRGVGGDIITLGSTDPPQLADGVRARFGGDVRVTDGAVIVELANGAEFVPRVVSAFPALVDSITVQRPTLNEVFLKLTGHAIRDETASDVDRMRLFSRAWRPR